MKVNTTHLAMLTTFNSHTKNRKLGGIPATRTERASCPTTCPFYDKGCYAKYGPESIHWSKMTNAMNWLEMCNQIFRLPKGQLWRHNTSGDLPHQNGIIDSQMLGSLVRANKNKKGFTFTHHILNEENISTIQEANVQGFTINASTESVEIADSIMTNHGIPAVSVIPSSETRRFFRTEKGRKVAVCPATIHENVSCASCGMCAQSNRDFIIGFPAHGAAKKTVDSIVTL